MKNIKKSLAIIIVFVGLLFGGNQALANTNNVARQLTIITQLLDVMQAYPQFSEVFKPLLDTAVEDLITSIESGQTTADNNKNKLRNKEVNTANYLKNTRSYANNPIVEIEADAYDNGKWEIEIEFKNEREYTMYVYDINSDSELIRAILEKIESEFDIELSINDIEDMLEIDDDSDDDDDDDNYKNN